MRRITTFLVLIGIFPFLGAQDNSPEKDGVGLFSSDSVLELTLWLDLAEIRDDLGEDPSYHDAILEYKDPEDQSAMRMDIQVKARGSFRKNPENCDFPPLKIKFDKTDKLGSIFSRIKDVKLVSHCQSGEKEFEQYVLQEYLIYKAYNLFTEYSFKVRLIRLTYVDISAGNDSLTRFAFLIEDAEDMAERNLGKLLDLKSVPSDKLDQHQFALMSFYNYMMLNTDYSVPILHNIELVSIDHFKPPIPVPYDFDWSGIIDIPYDSPFATEETRYIAHRYKGPCLKMKELEEVFSYMKVKKKNLYKLYREFPYLDEEMRVRSIQELNMFYITIGNRELIRKEFIKNCAD
ncbi:hypothetical protein ACFLTA_05455 [Bacteroidota bacterium]